jgi:hypothetical protein
MLYTPASNIRTKRRDENTRDASRSKNSMNANNPMIYGNIEAAMASTKILRNARSDGLPLHLRKG